jgi:integrase
MDEQVIEDVLHPTRAFERDHPNLLHRIHEYLEKYDGAERTKEHIVRFERTMTRYHEYRRELLSDTDFTLFVETVTLGQMNDFREYVANEYLLRQEYPDFYIPRMLINHKPKPLSNTTVINIMNLFCTFLHWCKRMKYSDNEVYAVYGCKEPTYGDPFYLTSEERNVLYDADLSDCPKLAVIRDIFVFHCYVGCRVGDLYRMTKENIKDGFLEYMPQKTKKCQAKTIRVPLHEKAVRILERYSGNTGKLLPFKPINTYNLGIRELLKHCGINRVVTILDTHGYNTVQKPLYEVASSHTARKTFVGNLYRQVPDPNLIASMSGHVEGSRAFRVTGR